MRRHTSEQSKTSQAKFGNFSEFSARLRAERAGLKLNQREFGQLGGVSLDTQSNYETGKHLPDAAYLARVAAAGVDVHYVLTGKRLNGQTLPAPANELLEDFLALSGRMREIVVTVVKAMREEEEDDPPAEERDAEPVAAKRPVKASR